MSPDLFMNRRNLMARALYLVGAASASLSAGPALALSSRREEPYLDLPAFNLLSAIADTILPRTDTPGAIDAGVPARFDSLLAGWASSERRHALWQAMKRIDEAARAETGRSFADLPPDRREPILAAHDLAAFKQVPDTRKVTGIELLTAGPAIADPDYAKLKELIAVLYYYSEEALTTELSYEHSPGGWTPSITVTPDSRAPGGLGVF